MRRWTPFTARRGAERRHSFLDRHFASLCGQVSQILRSKRSRLSRYLGLFTGLSCWRMCRGLLCRLIVPGEAIVPKVARFAFLIDCLVPPFEPRCRWPCGGSARLLGHQPLDLVHCGGVRRSLWRSRYSSVKEVALWRRPRRFDRDGGGQLWRRAYLQRHRAFVAPF